MNKGVLLSFFRWLLPAPKRFWRRHKEAIIQGLSQGLDFMTGEQSRIHAFCVRRLIETGKSLAINEIAIRLDLPAEQVIQNVNELEKRTALLVRNNEGKAVQAYPVIVEKAVHRLVMSIGEEVYAEGALGALAVPFVLGQLRGMHVSGHITTRCSYCRRLLHIIIDSDLAVKVVEEQAEPLIFLPLITSKAGTEGILFCLRNSTFYCSKDHAKEHRRRVGGWRGVYLALEQAINLTRQIQVAIFKFEAREQGE